ncbi:zinc dependent phospholipase C family protein [Microbulbifer sp. JMSA004]|uniref:zinc dependent phospholipase C family protein n=1 Tax=unclassified Microbulbifer TaxID=2619833 RepID=UPI0024AE038A|nr:zinc dependent phospholipase C family protein [Microbulbifer sp. VAAF005]WHI47308.1 zinc dependent phospholipase C family protein [Microbulbifer sp. VAAF005]
MFYKGKGLGRQFACLLLGLLATNQGWAFKLKSHVFVGQQVINDLADDGRVTFEINNNYYDIDVPDDVSSAILENQSAYLLGNIGPDASPDFVVGQTSVHPGALDKNEAGDAIVQEDSTRYNTDDWLKYLLTQKDASNTGKAYVYGYLGHASADVFAHTYVNQYSGDIFAIFDGESLNEKRHIALESYIDSRVPVLRDYLGEALGEPYQRIDLNDDELFEFLRDKLIYADIPTEQYEKNPMASHLAAISKFREELYRQATDARGYWHTIDVWVVQYLIEYYAGYSVPESLASDLVDIGNDLIDETNVAIDKLQSINSKLLSYKRDFEDFGFDSVTSALDKAQSSYSDLTNKRQELEEALLDWRSEVAINGCEFAIKSIDPTGLVDEAINLDPVANMLGLDSVEEVVEYSLDPLGLFGSLFGGDDGDHWTETGNGISAYEVFSDSYFNEWSENLKADIESEQIAYTRNFALGHLPLINSGVLAALELTREIIPAPFVPIAVGDVVVPIVNNKTYDWNVRVSTSYDYVDRFWVKESSSGKIVIHFEAEKLASDDVGVCENLSKMVYSADYAALNAIHKLEDEVNDMAEKNIEDVEAAYEEMKEAEDHLYAIQDAAVDLMQLLNSNVSPVQSIFEMWQSSIDVAMTEYTRTTATMMVNTMNENASNVDPLSDWVSCYGPTFIGVPSQACDIWKNTSGIIEALSNVLDILDSAPIPVGLIDAREELRKVIDGLKEEVKEYAIEEVEDMLPTEFKELIDLLDAPMTDTALNTWYSKNESHSEHLVKIPDMAYRVTAEMQLDGNGDYSASGYPVVANAITLAKLALLDAEGLKALARTQGLSESTFNGVSADNLVAGAFKSIDGNHQWMTCAPPLPRSIGSEDKYRFFDNYSSSSGFVLWQDGSARESLFNGLFKGPLTSGVTNPSLIGFEWILDAGSAYKTLSESFPYPDEQCASDNNFDMGL